jgi:hypothetical protein
MLLILYGAVASLTWAIHVVLDLCSRGTIWATAWIVDDQWDSDRYALREEITHLQVCRFFVFCLIHLFLTSFMRHNFFL